MTQTFSASGALRPASIFALLACLLFSQAGNAAAQAGPFNVLVQDKSIVTDIKTDNDNNVWIRLASSELEKPIVVRISNRNRDFYRKWFTGELDLVSTGYRGNDVWSDRVQTKAQYIEYWLDETLILHLERR